MIAIFISVVENDNVDYIIGQSLIVAFVFIIGVFLRRKLK